MLGIDTAKTLVNQTVTFVKEIDYVALKNQTMDYAQQGKDLGVQGFHKGLEYSSVGGEYTISGVDYVVPWLVTILYWVKVLLPLVAIGYAGYRFFFVAKDYFIEGNPNEYTILCRDGNCIKQGIGLSTWVLPGDKIVTFPSQLCQVNFQAEQVTLEMQGVRVSGLLIWSPYREGDGPSKLFRAFGDDLKRKNSPNIGVKIGNIARSIIRDKIANMTIDDVLKNRAALRDAIKKDIQTLLTGWGMWLETIEVSDVQICSSTLFGNMQAEFKEQERLKAQQITAASEDKIRKAKLNSDIDYKIESQK